MINKVGIEHTRTINSVNNKQKRKSLSHQDPSFKGLGAIALSGIQACERMPMVNVAVIDMLSAILPRTIVESMTNWFAGFEAFRRESSGLVVNCLIPGAMTLGIAHLINNQFMGKDSNMANCWADRNFIDLLSETYKNSTSDNKTQETIKKVLGNIEGFEGQKRILFKKDSLSEEEINNFTNKLVDLSKSKQSDKEIKKEVKKIANEIIEKTRVSENITVLGEKSNIKVSSVTSVLEDSVKFLKEFQKVESKIGIEEFAKRSKKLVMAKSGLGFAVILPLAISMQYINRWITEKVSGVKGAPIYDDFGKNNSQKIENPKSKEGLLKQKIISISSMLGVSLLSMMKKPSINMLEFKGPFPTMDQARIVSTATFASRMAAADDKNELAEATVRDIATFSSLYFLGDYAAKGAATLIQKNTGVSLLNDTKPLDNNANILQKVWHWVKDVNIKSSEEVISKTEEALKKAGKAITEADKETIKKELNRAKNLRSICQVTNVGVSLALLGIVIPIFTRKSTKKKHELEKKLALENNQLEQNKPTEIVTPLNVEYSKLTQGFRAQKS